jgi:hypothetical protein
MAPKSLVNDVAVTATALFPAVVVVAVLLFFEDPHATRPMLIMTAVVVSVARLTVGFILTLPLCEQCDDIRPPGT